MIIKIGKKEYPGIVYGLVVRNDSAAFEFSLLVHGYGVSVIYSK